MPGASATPLYLLHGWAMNNAVWSGLGERLSGRHRVIPLELPGHGHAAPPARERDAAEALLVPIAPHMVQPCMLLGWSLGGLLAMALAADHGVACQRLVVMASSPCFVQREGWDMALHPGVLDDFAKRLEQDPSRTMASFMNLQFLGCASGREHRQRLEQALTSRPLAQPSGLAAGLEVLRGLDLRDRLARLAMPILVIQGGRDRIVPPAAAEALVAALPDARLEIIPAAGHAPFMSHGETVTRLVREFLDA